MWKYNTVKFFGFLDVIFLYRLEIGDNFSLLAREQFDLCVIYQ